MRNALALSFLLLVMAGCASAPSPTARLQTAERDAADAGWQRIALNAPPFLLTAYGPLPAAPVSTLKVYIEGDGLAWLNGNTPSDDPSPIEPLALHLALKDGDNAAYLARPCQYQINITSTCKDDAWWTNKRFAPSIATAMNSAIDQLKARYNARQITLIGYSGGGAIAALVAVQRDDIQQLVTIAGNLDTDFWVKEHRLEPLTGSLNPATLAPQLANIPQLHFSGSDDKVIPPDVAQSYASHFPAGKKPALQVMDGYTHKTGWVENWPQLMREAQLSN